MLKRQKVLLALLQSAKRPLSRIALVKLAFLLRQETPLSSDATFYDFVPYRYGPFSFALYREISSLERDGYVRQTEHTFALEPRCAALTRGAVAELPLGYADSVADIHRSYGRLSRKALVDHVYARYPWFATRSQLRDHLPPHLPTPSVAEPAAYTVGYEGKSVDRFFDDLLRRGIQSIVDVRANPVSRKYGFSGRSLCRIAIDLGLEYHHLPNLGIPPQYRANLNGLASYQRLFRRYEQEMLPSQEPAIQILVGLLTAKPSTMLCVEKDIRCCHRAPLAKLAATRSGLSVVHL